jgi:hypothetical protein
MVDEERQTVYIRLPAPQLMEPVALDENSIHKYSFDSDGKITYALQAMTGSVQNGEDEAKSMRHEASVQILNKLKYDVEYQHESKKAAISIISTLIRELNPAVDNLKVFVDFY